MTEAEATSAEARLFGGPRRGYAEDRGQATRRAEARLRGGLEARLRGGPRRGCAEGRGEGTWRAYSEGLGEGTRRAETDVT